MFRSLLRRPEVRFIWINSLFCCLLGSGIHPALAQTAQPSATQSSAAATVEADGNTSEKLIVQTKQSLIDLQKQQDAIKQQITPETDAAQLGTLNIRALSLVEQADDLAKVLLPHQQQIQIGLDLLGPQPARDAPAEAPEISTRRSRLKRYADQVNALLHQIDESKQSSLKLSSQLLDLRGKVIKALAFKRTDSILSPTFWRLLWQQDPTDRQRLNSFTATLRHTIAATWRPSLRWQSTGWLLGAVLLWVLGRRLSDRLIAWGCGRWLPAGRLRRSLFACLQVAASMSLAMLALDMLQSIFSPLHGMDVRVHTFLGDLGTKILACVLISELGRALLSTAQPSWRLPPISDELAHELRYTPTVVAGVMIVFQAIEIMNQSAGTHLQVTLFGYGLNALALTLTFSWLLVKISLKRQQLEHNRNLQQQNDKPHQDKPQQNDKPHRTPQVEILARVLIRSVVAATLLALVIGYISMARLFTYELVWAFIVVASAYFLLNLLIDICNGLFSRDHRPGQALQETLGLQDRQLDQASIILSGATRAVLIVLALLALITSSFGTSPGELIQNLINKLSGGLLNQLNINLTTDKIFNAIITCGIGLYLVRVLCRWLDQQLLPKTGMDPGMRSSLVTLATNIGYVLIVLGTMSALGIEWDKLAWIVSALSVGIGFGLQEIVKNFISGLILLTERPVKVGDMISIGGSTGDVQRIKVRATEIQLSDRSTMIVPNSQLISSSLVNLTMNRAKGVVSIAFKFPSHIDAGPVSDLLLDAFKNNSSILNNPPPSVSFSELGASVIELSVSGYVMSPRLIDGTKSTLRFDLLKRLRDAGMFPLEQSVGVISITLTLPLDTDPNQARDLLLKAYTADTDILKDPAPSVSFTNLDATGITLTVSGHIDSPYHAKQIKSSLLFEIVTSLRAAGIALSAPQSIVLENAIPATDAPAKAPAGPAGAQPSATAATDDSRPPAAH